MLDTERNLPQGLLDPHFEQRCPSFNLPTRMWAGCLTWAGAITGRGQGRFCPGEQSAGRSPSLTEPPVGGGVSEHAP